MPLRFKRFQFGAFNTRCTLILEDSDPAATETFVCRAVDWTRGFQARFSRFEPESIVSKVNRAAGRESVAETPEFSSLLDLAERAFDATGGRVDISVPPLYRLWAGDGNAGAPPSPREILEARSLVGFHKITRSGGRVSLPQAGMRIDLGGLGKEFAVDRVVDMGREAGLAGGLVSFGGDIRVFGSPPDARGWRIGVVGAAGCQRRSAHLRLRSGALATSGPVRPGIAPGGSRPHLVDPRTGKRCKGSHTVTVHADHCAEAGGWATAATLEDDPPAASLFLERAGVCGLVVDHAGMIFETTPWRRRFAQSMPGTRRPVIPDRSIGHPACAS